LEMLFFLFCACGEGVAPFIIRGRTPTSTVHWRARIACFPPHPVHLGAFGALIAASEESPLSGSGKVGRGTIHSTE